MRGYVKTVCCLGIVLLSGFPAWTQVNNTLYFMSGVPQSNRVNPAYQPDCGLYIGIPLLAPVRGNVASSSYSFGDFIYPNATGDSLIYFTNPDGDVQAFLEKNRSLNYLVSDLGTSLLSLGFRTKIGFFTLDVSTRVDGNIYFPGDLARLLLESEHDGTYHMDGIGADASAFDEISVGWSGDLGDKLRIGVRGKAMFGLGNLSTTSSEMSVYISEEAWVLKSNMVFNASLPFAEVQYDDEGMIDGIVVDEGLTNLNPVSIARYAFRAQNFGMGIDMGVDYRPNDRWRLSASVLDLGYIHWKDSVHQVSYINEYEHSFVEVNPLEFRNDNTLSSYADSVLTQLADTLSGAIEFTPGVAYNSYLKTKIVLGASWYATPNINLGILSRTDFLKESIVEHITATANFAAGRFLNFTLSYSYIHSYFKNIGAGVSFNAGPVNIYAISDNALNAVFWPQEARAVNLWVGLNLVFGYKDKEDRPLVY